VLDTGIYPHDDLVKPQNRIVAFKDFIRKRKKPYDDNGHGTHVAGDIAGNGYGSKGLYKAPAFESTVAGVKVLDKYGSGRISTIISGIEWCLENKDRFNIKAICMSLGSQAVQSYKEDILCEAVAKAWEAGILVCVAAGNEGPEKGTISSPGIDPRIITVGAANDKNTILRSDDEIAAFSSRGPTIDGLNKPDIVCPGTNIISLRSPNSYLDKQLTSSRVSKCYFTLSGTSMATPLCCAAAALLLEKDPKLTPGQVKEMITQSSQDMGFDRNTQGRGYLDIQRLLDGFANNISSNFYSEC
jgi:serine protease AprX